jgi:hypothetical protein
MAFDFDLKYVAGLIPAIPPYDYGAICRYYAKLPRPLQIEAHRQHTAIMRTRWNERRQERQAEFTYATFLQALVQMRRQERATDARDIMSDEAAQRVSDLRDTRISGMKKGKSSPTKQLIERKYLLLIEQMRSAGKSWRDIAVYLRKYHRQRLSYTYLRRVYLGSKAQKG